ncbi:MAG: hypothetical protein U0694_02475 [Anaerolineae bacterium]
MPPHIGTLREKSLHAALKAWYVQPGDALETAVNGYVVDIVRDGQTLIEIQTRSFSSMKPKLTTLLEQYTLRLVHPVALERFVVRVDSDGVVVSRRKSPKRGQVFDVFRELVSFPTLLAHPHFSLEVLLIHEEQIWRDDGQGSWRRKGWSIHDRRLLEVVESIVLVTPQDCAALIPPTLTEPFDCKELASAVHIQRPLAQKMAYCLREMGALQVTGKRGKALLYAKA